MMTALTFEEIDRAIYNHLRIGLVAYGCLPDVSNFTNEETYQSARDTIKENEKNTGMPLVDIYGIGTGESRESTESTKIVLDRNTGSSGSIGGNYTSRMEKVGEKWVKKRNSEGSLDISYEVRTLTSKTGYDRILSTLVLAVLGTCRYLPVFANYTEETDKYFLLSYDGSVNVSATIDTIERLHRFTVKDVFLEQPSILEGTGTIGDSVIRKDIVPLTSIHFKTNLYWDGDPIEVIEYKGKN